MGGERWRGERRGGRQEEECRKIRLGGEREETEEGNRPWVE